MARLRKDKHTLGHKTKAKLKTQGNNEEIKQLHNKGQSQNQEEKVFIQGFKVTTKNLGENKAAIRVLSLVLFS